MRTKMEEMTEKMRTMVAAHAQTPPPPPVRTQAEASSSAIPEWTICADTPTHSAPQRFVPWVPPFSAGEILRPVACEAQIHTHQYTAQVPPFSTGEIFCPVQMPTRQHAAHAPPPPVRAPLVNMTYSAPVIHTVEAYD